MLGLLAAMLGHYDEADTHFSRAVEFCQHRGLPTWLARTRSEWAAMLRGQGGTVDAERARLLAAEALAGARTLGMAGVAARSEAILNS